MRDAEEQLWNMRLEVVDDNGKKRFIIDWIPVGEKDLHVSSPNCICKPQVAREGYDICHNPIAKKKVNI